MIDNSKETIKDKLIQYAIALDSRNWVLLDHIFHENAVATYGSKKFNFVLETNSRIEILQMCKDSLGGCGTTQHLLSNFRINVNSDQATSKCYVRAYHVGLAPNENESYEMYGEYQDSWKLFGNDWMIEKRILRVDHETGNREKVLAPGD
tara:strand:- start:490 stop:939 length:450 start_codon:yes stop_codon:yes gene_type:complete